MGREWSAGLAVLKVDLARAFDSIKRDVLLSRLPRVMGTSGEYRAWYRLMQGTSCLLCRPWGQSEFAVRVGIRQIVVESPLFFSLLQAAMVPTETSTKNTKQKIKPGEKVKAKAKAKAKACPG